jgi:K+-transporting ATPase ATPase A chain
VFIAGLMIGRTPEYLGKKIEAFEMKMAIAILVTPLLVLGGTALAVLTEAGRRPGQPGAHGFSEVLYAFSSAANNNGSAFAGLSANTPFYNLSWRWPCGWAASASSCRCWPSPARWPPRSAWP